MSSIIGSLIVVIVIGVAYLVRRKVWTFKFYRQADVDYRLKAIDAAVHAAVNAERVDFSDVWDEVLERVRDLEAHGELYAGATERYVEMRLAYLRTQAAKL